MTPSEERDILRGKIQQLRQAIPYPELTAEQCRSVANLIEELGYANCGISKDGMILLLVGLAENMEVVRDIITPPETINRATPPTTTENPHQ